MTTENEIKPAAPAEAIDGGRCAVDAGFGSSECCKHGDLACGQGYYHCGKCARERRAQAYLRLTPAQKAYDRHVDPAGAYHTDFPSGCSCHIDAPCSFCLSLSEEQADALWNRDKPNTAIRHGADGPRQTRET